MNSSWLSNSECLACARKGYILVKHELEENDTDFTESSDLDSEDGDVLMIETDRSEAPMSPQDQIIKKNDSGLQSYSWSELVLPGLVLLAFMVYYVYRSGLLAYFVDTT